LADEAVDLQRFARLNALRAVGRPLKVRRFLPSFRTKNNRIRALNAATALENLNGL